MIDELYNLTVNKNRSLEIAASLRGIQKTGREYEGTAMHTHKKSEVQQSNHRQRMRFCLV